MIEVNSRSQPKQPHSDIEACIACNSEAMLSGFALGAAEEAAACCPGQSANPHGQAGTRWEQAAPDDLLMFGCNIHSETSGPPASIHAAKGRLLAAPDQQLEMPPVRRRLVLPPTLLPPAAVPSDCSPPADWSRPAMGAAAADDMPVDPVSDASPHGQSGLRLLSIPAQQSGHQGVTHPGPDGVRAVLEHTPERDSSAAFPMPHMSDTQRVSAAPPAAQTDMHTTAVAAAVLAGAGHGCKWHFKPGSSKLLVEIDTSVICNTGQIDAAFAHVAQAVKGLPSILSGTGPVMPTTESAARWISQSPHAIATQAASSEEVSNVLSSLLLQVCMAEPS